MAMASMFFFLTQFIQDVLGLRPLATGFAFLPMAVMLFTVARFVPRLLARFGPKPLAITGTALMVIGLVRLTQLTATSSCAGALVGPMILLGLGGGIGFTPLNVIIMSTVPVKDAGAAGGALQTMQQVGSTLGLAVLVTVFGRVAASATARGQSATAVLVSGMTSAYVAAAAIALSSFVVALTFRGQRG
jgi:MFS family permease